MMENVASMPKEAKEEITAQLFGIEPVMINAALVSAQSRKRLYWVGKRNFDGTYSRVEVRQPEDRGIVLKDVLEEIPFDATNAKGEPVWKPVPEKFLAVIAEKIAKFSTDRKAFSLTATYDKACIQNHLKHDRTVLVTIPHGHFDGRVDDEKTLALTKSGWEDNNKLVAQFRRTDLRIHAEQDKVCNPQVDGKRADNDLSIPTETRIGINEDPGKSNTLTTFDKDNIAVGTDAVRYYWRKLTVRECARLQGFPDSYEFPVSDSRAYKGIGNSWQRDVIDHVFGSFDFSEEPYDEF